MARFKVRPGAELPHNGVVLTEADPAVELPRAVGNEVRHLVYEVNENDEAVSPPAWALPLEGRPTHEHSGVLRAQRDELLAKQSSLAELIDQKTAELMSLGGERASVIADITAINQEILKLEAAPPEPVAVQQLPVLTKVVEPDTKLDASDVDASQEGE